MANSPRPGRRSARRGPAILVSLIALAAAGGLSFLGARSAADFIETNATRDLGAALAQFDWLTVRADGLQVRLGGTAPDEIQRVRALTLAETVVDPNRVLDDMQVTAKKLLVAPDFKVELLRNDQGITIIGLVPAALDRDAMVASLRRQTAGAEVSDLLEAADYPVPEGWDAAFSLGLSAAQLAPQAKISVRVGEVSVRAITGSPQEKQNLEAALKRLTPAGVTLNQEVSAPRPVIAPFTLRFVHDVAGPRFDACAADTEAARARILKVGVELGVPGNPQCTLGLGAPSGRWADAAVAGIVAVGTMGAGSVTISDTDVALFAPADVEPARFDEAVGRLQGALPPAFTLSARHEQASAAGRGPAEFSAVVDAGGVSLRGLVLDERMRGVVESLARSHFGEVDSMLRVDGAIPDGWTLRAIAGLEAIEGLQRGMVTVTPDLIRITGVSGSRTASDLAAARLSQQLGAGARYELAIRYDRRLDPLLGLPSGVECVDQLNAAMRESEIGFEPNKSVIAGDPGPTLARLAETMSNCADFRIEVGGHTDSQGSEGFNAELSRRRAQAILEAMTGAGIDTTHMTARGYGESQPLADNETDAGREANRRIEFVLLSDEPVMVNAPQPAELVKGVTDAPDALAAKLREAAIRAATGALHPVFEDLKQAEAGGSQGPDTAAINAATRPAAAAIGRDPADALVADRATPEGAAAYAGSRPVQNSAGLLPELPGAVLPAIVPMSPPDVGGALRPQPRPENN
ncbi:OmpA-OmpF porin, OOP family [Paracoccus halophilus]|uniref:OmpA-OmpF porin, OOP family n=1 Tax=Paracoccus halophilus TaxID=376733 RepID=A0A1I0TS57_9RHOB|nr:OmpA family protein [Paracoccus halophilus]SFA54517.1 OmpA-OmpF porin, OOP family [Paracoccus halophilus]